MKEIEVDRKGYKNLNSSLNLERIHEVISGGGSEVTIKNT
jgi:hypothetical protein